jgi:hypothetical protein
MLPAMARNSGLSRHTITGGLGHGIGGVGFLGSKTQEHFKEKIYTTFPELKDQDENSD